MDKLSSQEEKRLKKAMDEVGLEKPTQMFTANVLNALKSKTVKHKQPGPLLSTRGWVVVFLGFILCCSMIFFYPTEGIHWFKALEQLNGRFPQLVFDGIQISKTTVFALSLMGLFLLQLPFLMQLINKQHEIE